MTRKELRDQLLQGRVLDELFHFKSGQDCLIYKADSFEKGDTIIYIPDICLNNIPVDRPITEPMELIEVLSQCYTGADFLEECEEDKEMAERLFWYCDWQHPSSAYPEIYDEEE